MTTSNDKTAEEIEREILNDMSLKADFYGMEYAPFMFSVFKKFSLYKEQETTASDNTIYIDRSAQQLKEYKEVIRELLPFVEERSIGIISLSSSNKDKACLLRDRARKLIDKTDTK